MESQDQQNLCKRVIFHLFENFEKQMSIDFFIPTLNSQDSSSQSYRLVPLYLCRSEIYNLLLLNFFLVESSGAQSPFLPTMKYAICSSNVRSSIRVVSVYSLSVP